MKNQRLVIPLTMSNKAYFVEAEIRVVKNEKSKNFGKVSIYTDMGYNPLTDHSSYDRYMSYDDAKNLLSELGFIDVSDNFDQYDTESIRTIKSQLPKEWIENYNLWVNYTG